nr:WD and tetratricopeptide repeats protein 1 isoform X1 [Ipomoea batatas]
MLFLFSTKKKSLADPPKQFFALKSCDISLTKPHLLLLGGSDVFARVYDRRMLPPLSSSQKKLAPPSRVNYFCLMHMSNRLEGENNLHKLSVIVTAGANQSAYTCTDLSITGNTKLNQRSVDPNL